MTEMNQKNVCFLCFLLLEKVFLRSWYPFDGVYPESFDSAQDRLRRRAQACLAQ